WSYRWDTSFTGDLLYPLPDCRPVHVGLYRGWPAGEQPPRVGPVDVAQVNGQFISHGRDSLLGSFAETLIPAVTREPGPFHRCDLRDPQTHVEAHENDGPFRVSSPCHRREPVGLILGQCTTAVHRFRGDDDYVDGRILPAVE